MKASELITRLQELIDEHGDLDVTKSIYTTTLISEVFAYDKNGGIVNPFVEFYIH